ncbi:MAG: cation transporting ATPase C-terminal domain-containing protein, partial [Planctomycetaceae bacterium]
LGIVLGTPLPLLPVHILWVNLVTDGLPALALGFEPAERDIMQRPPRPRREGLFADGLAWGVLGVGLLMAVCCFAVFAWMLGREGPTELPGGNTVTYARTQVFMVLSLSQLFYVLAVRSSSESFFRQSLWSNYRLTGAVVVGIALQMAVIYTPFLQEFFHTVPLSAQDVAIGVLAALPAFVVVDAWKAIRRSRRE